ncbi:hypothetical protein BH09PSE4_BH09PSE4_23740 [soil metagenome]
MWLNTSPASRFVEITLGDKIDSMDPRNTLFDSVDPAAEAEADARADADVRAGRVISHGAVKRWLGSWGTDRQLPRPEIGD